MKRKSAWLAVGMAGTLLWGGFLAFPPGLSAQEKTIVWNIPHTAAPSYYHIPNLKLFADKVKEKSKGRMEIRVHPASSLYPQNEQIPAVVDGRVEIAPILSGYMVDMFLEMAALDLPFHDQAPWMKPGRRRKNSGLTTSNAWPRRISCSWPSGPGPPSSFSRRRNPSPKWRTGKGPRFGSTAPKRRN